mmetsp:Transcript_72760/g.109739  ORF Transcript_72760/g.109739 Transcript_72760/m.109739 type:complete len:410 (-) Transcript_72760:48-1277(-)
MSDVVIRIRTPFGMTRSTFPNNSTLQEVITKVQNELLKKNQKVDNPALYHAPKKSDSVALPTNKTLKDLKFANGEMLELVGGFQSTVIEIPDSEKSIFDLPAIQYEPPACSLHGPDHSCVRCMTAKYIRVDRKDKSDCVGIEADKKAIAVFKYNMEKNLGYSVQRLGILYGQKKEDGWLQIDFIYEPPQENSDTDILLLDNQNEQKFVDTIANSFGLTKLGCIIGQTAADCEDEEFILTAQQILQFAEVKGDAEDFVILFSGIRDNIPFVEGYELTDQFYDLYRRRYFLRPKDDFFLQVKEPLWIQAKEEMEAEVEFFIAPVPLKEYRNTLRCEFPVENRQVKQSAEFVRTLISHQPGANLADLLSDFHLLLFLAPFFGEADLAALCAEVREGTLAEGHDLIIRNIAQI